MNPCIADMFAGIDEDELRLIFAELGKYLFRNSPSGYGVMFFGGEDDRGEYNGKLTFEVSR